MYGNKNKKTTTVKPREKKEISEKDIGGRHVSWHNLVLQDKSSVGLYKYI